MSYSVKISNSKELEKNLRLYAKKANLSIDEAVDITAHEIRNEAILILGQNKTNNTGRLKQSITVQKTKEGGAKSRN